MRGSDEELTEFEWLLLEISRMKGCAVTKERVLNLFSRMTGRRVYFAQADAVRPQREEMARRLLEKGVPRARAKDRLVTALGISTRTAYRLLERALNHPRQNRSNK